MNPKLKPFHSLKVKLTNLDKIYWPDEGYTKKDLIEYYKNISSFILPYIKDRPQSLNRHPDGINGESFFQKDIDPPYPSWIRTLDYYSKSTDKIVNYLVCKDLNTLLYMANLGCIEINPWGSRVSNLRKPDFLILDLDPEGIGFDKVVEVAIVIKKILDEIKINGYCKTSGGRGLHVYIPLKAKYTFNKMLKFSKILALIINQTIPDITSLVRSPKHRKGKVYIDCYQNSVGHTIVAPYSLRPRTGAPVSTPLLWKELNSKLNPLNFTIKTIFKRLDKKGDLWKGVLGPGIDMKACTNRISKFYPDLLKK
jgi:bifunctional non-homologous end joining protein LigD